MTNDPYFLYAVAAFAFFAAVGDVMKLFKWRTLRQAGCVLKLAAPLTGGYIAYWAAQKAAHISMFEWSWSATKPLLLYLGIAFLFVHVIFSLDRHGYINLLGEEDAAGEPPAGKPADGAAD
jgi:hypothetical protein